MLGKIARAGNRVPVGMQIGFNSSPLTQQLRARQSQSPEAGWAIERCVGGRRDVFSDEQIAERRVVGDVCE